MLVCINGLTDAIVHEGLADHFSVELCGGDPPLWSVALSEAELDRFTEVAIGERDSGSYDHGVWFLGRKPAVTPRWAGYAVGWRVVGDHLRHHPDEPARSVGLYRFGRGGRGRVCWLGCDDWLSVVLITKRGAD